MALAPLAAAVLFAAAPIRQGPGRVPSLPPWRYFVLSLGRAVSASALVGAVVRG
jgi:hypothetical protein